MLRFVWRQITALISTVLLLVLSLTLLLAYRYASHEQLDDSERLAAKLDYLDELAQVPLAQDAPNVIFILYDDLGYGDIGAGTQSNLIATPHLDRLARDGVALTDFHSPAPVCTPSRAGYLTGRLPLRAGLPNVVFPSSNNWKGSVFRILNPQGNVRLPAEEITLADILKSVGYATGMVGKWHLGDVSPSLPNDMGFDEFYGALHSNDMTPFAHYRNGEIALEAPVDQRYMSQIYTEEAVSFITENREQPFFLYFAHNFPHDPLHVRQERAGQSRAGLFGDVMEEIDEGIGTLITTLTAYDLLDNTLILVSSDNGPWFLGDSGDLRGRKGNTFEGGMRVPFIAHWPARIAPGRIEDAMSMGTDLLPTVLEILALPSPDDRIIDGRSLLNLLTKGGESPHEYLFYFDAETLFAARSETFKYRGPAGVFYGTDQMPFAFGVPQKEWLFDLEGDPRESYDTSLKHPEALGQLRDAFEAKRVEMQRNLRGWR
ncbi:MAG: sulfatase [Pseudomonadota bacterium]